MIKLNENWSIEHHVHGGFNLIESKPGVNKKTGKPTVSKRSYYYPNLKLCAAKMVEQNFDNEAQTIDDAVDSMLFFAVKITKQLEKVIDYE